MTEKLIIGSANFGLTYGIANRKKLSKKTIFEILQLAAKASIFGIDTAYAYGNAEEIVGEFITQYSPTFQLITKLPPLTYDKPQAVKNALDESFKRLCVRRIQYVLLHSYKSYAKYQDIVIPILQDYKRKKHIEFWGVSVYHPAEIIQILKDGWKEIAIEFPLNIFDRRFLKNNLLSSLKAKGCTLFARSIFLQGLFFIPEKKIGHFFSSVIDRLLTLHRIAEEYNITVADIALLFVANHELLDGVIIGVDSKNQLANNLNSFSYQKNFAAIGKRLNELEVVDNKIILPYLWTS